MKAFSLLPLSAYRALLRKFIPAAQSSLTEPPISPASSEGAGGLWGRKHHRPRSQPCSPPPRARPWWQLLLPDTQTQDPPGSAAWDWKEVQ